ncbi:MAG: hypothetical protein EOO65_01315 [Methanosarcinales archaeon]|nr:MAG: hypothetical protein EOO65_01315 [Methanosarcinales archaeon]
MVARHHTSSPARTRTVTAHVRTRATYDTPDLQRAGDLKITQSLAIMRYIARKYDTTGKLYGGSAEELARQDMLLDQVNDFRQNVSRCAYGGLPLDALVHSVVPSFLSGFEEFIARSGTKFLASDEVTLVDFTFFEVRTAHALTPRQCSVVAQSTRASFLLLSFCDVQTMDSFRVMVKELSSTDPLAAYPGINGVLANFEALPAVRTYFASADFHARPFNNKVGMWK